MSETISSYSINAVFLGSITIAILIFLSLVIKKQNEAFKIIVFSLIVLVVFGITLFLSASTIYLNNISLSKGPVHYHADFEVWNCGVEEDLKNPQGLSNKIGATAIHEHNDNRIHIEGVIVEEKDASLEKFFKVIGGSISTGLITFPSHSQLETLKDGDLCPNGSEGKLQVFLYKSIGGKYIQQKLADPANYIISPEIKVPPGDCIIIEFDSLKDKTDKLCESINAAKLRGEFD